jgi:hypothetical protein
MNVTPILVVPILNTTWGLAILAELCHSCPKFSSVQGGKCWNNILK